MYETELAFARNVETTIREAELRVLAATNGYPSEVALAALCGVATFYISEDPNPREAGVLWGDAVKRFSASLKK